MTRNLATAYVDAFYSVTWKSRSKVTQVIENGTFRQTAYKFLLAFWRCLVAFVMRYSELLVENREFFYNIYL